MSWRVTNLCSGRRFGSPVRKQIIMFLADKASDDGSGIWCSKGTIARHTELGDSTVKRAINEFLDEGILIQTGQRPCANGYTAIYQINCDAVEVLELIAEPDLTGSRADRVHAGRATGSTADRVPGPERTPNHPKTILKPPPTHASVREEATVSMLDDIWDAYPSDRQRNKPECLKRIKEALREVPAEELLIAVQKYAAISTEFTRSKVSFSDNWFRERRWISLIEEQRIALKVEQDVQAKLQERVLEQSVAWAKSGSAMCRHISDTVLSEAMARGLISAAEARTARDMR